MKAVLDVLMLALNFYWWIVIIAVIFSWLYAFNVINTTNNFIASVGRMIYQMTEPVFQWVRRFIPSIGGLDAQLCALHRPLAELLLESQGQRAGFRAL